MEVNLEQVAGQIADVSKQLSAFETRLTGAVTDLKGQADANLVALKDQADVNLAGLKDQADANLVALKDQADVNLAGLKDQADVNLVALKDQANVNLADLKQQARLNMEELKQEVKLVAEGYAATLEGIERELSALNKKVDTKFGDHDLVLADHNTRITTLERR